MPPLETKVLLQTIEGLIIGLADAIHESRQVPRSLAHIPAEVALKHVPRPLLNASIAALQNCRDECRDKYPAITASYTLRIDIIQRAIANQQPS